jgi:hypothetical protein
MPVKITISPELLNLSRRAAQKLAVGQQAIALYGETQIKQQIRAVDAVASGSLLNNVRRLNAPSNVVRIGSDKIQAQFVEEGRPPGPVPRWSVFKPILQAWAKAKGLNIPESALYPIALKIKEQGFKGRFPFKKAAEISAPGAVRILERTFEGL